MDFQGALDTVAANFDPARDRILATRPLKFGERVYQSGEEFPLDTLTAEQVKQLIRVKHATVDVGGNLKGDPAPRKAAKKTAKKSRPRPGRK
jgi:hypothetical protein